MELNGNGVNIGNDLQWKKKTIRQTATVAVALLVEEMFQHRDSL